MGLGRGRVDEPAADMRRLSERVPDHPVVLHGLHTFAVWGNRLAFERAGITKDTASPSGGEIKKDASGNPTGVLLNNASALLTSRGAAAHAAQLADAHPEGARRDGRRRLHVRARSRRRRRAARGARVARRRAVDCRCRCTRCSPPGTPRSSTPWRARSRCHRYRRGRLVVRGVKAFYDGAMGSRGALFLEPYSDRPGHRGVGGADTASIATAWRR